MKNAEKKRNSLCKRLMNGNYVLTLQRTFKWIRKMSKQEKEEKAKEFWEYYEATQGSIVITDSVVLD